MKTLRLALTACIAAFSVIAATAQITCDSLSIISIEPDTFNVNNTLINIQMAGTEMDFINYPFIPAVWDCNGDTIASGNMFFFGQIGSTTQGYPVTALSADVCFPLTIQFVYGIGDFVPENDTCLFTFGTINVPAPTEQHSDLRAYPNPTDGDIQLSSPSSLINAPYFVFDLLGKTVLQGNMHSTQTTIPLDGLSKGIYLLRVGQGATDTITIVKE